MLLSGEWVKRCREDGGVSVLEVASALGLPPRIVEEIEGGNPAYCQYLLPALNAAQKLTREFKGQAPDRPWAREVCTQGIATHSED